MAQMALSGNDFLRSKVNYICVRACQPSRPRSQAFFLLKTRRLWYLIHKQRNDILNAHL